MKKLLVLVLAAVGGYVVYRKVQDDRLDADLWAEATTDTVDLT
jgi:hypothetical protein